MKYFIVVLMMFLFAACGTNSNSNTPPTSPNINDISKKPPSIPKI